MMLLVFCLSSSACSQICKQKYKLKFMATIDQRILLAKAHISHHSHLLPFDFLPSHPLLSEYLLSTLYTIILAILFYFSLSSISYLVFYKLFPQRYLPLYNQRAYPELIWHDIKWSLLNILGQAPCVAFLKLGYPYYSKIKYEWEWSFSLLINIGLFIIYDQFMTYWAHRLLHHPKIYRYLHYAHHESKSVTPFCGFAFHPIDAFIQALPIFTSAYLIPLPLDIVLAFGMLTSIWAVSIHDNINFIPFKLFLYAGHHSIHHFPFGQNYNYGKFTSICDRLYGTYCDPQGIAGYGYETKGKVREAIQYGNKIVEKVVGDRGKNKVERETRQFILKSKRK